MRLQISIFFLLAGFILKPAASYSGTYAEPNISFDFCGQPVELTIHPTMVHQLGEFRDRNSILAFCNSLLKSDHRELAGQIITYREKYQMDDWLFYQLVRRAAQQISPKADDYYRYTLYKWFLLHISGYNPTLRISDNKLLFYVQSDENIYNIPFYIKQGKQFVCLNYHDYGNDIAFDHESFEEVNEPRLNDYRPFSYRVTHLPDFRPGDYQEKDISFIYNEKTYHFKVKLNPQIKSIFINYPAVDYASILNIPLSKETYQTLIPILKKTLHGMKPRDGVDYLMRFTRDAFIFGTDVKNFGKEKRLTPEQTLLYDQSDCEDRVALFYCLVKEIYNLPMIILSFPGHVTMGIRIEKPSGNPIIYNGEAYTLCEPTPQKYDLPIGQLAPELKKLDYEIVYAYTPASK